MTENYRHLYVVIEQIDGKFLQVSLEMIGEARRLLDNFNSKYSSKEKVVAVILGHNIKDMSKQLIECGADTVIYSDHPELKDIRNTIYTKVISQIAQDKKTLGEVEPEYASEVKRPRYMFFAADSIGRHLSSTVLTELESGLASDINKLVIEDIEMSHQQKTAGSKETYAKTLEIFLAPILVPASKRIACFPRFDNCFRAANPAEPPPIIATSYFSKFIMPQ